MSARSNGNTRLEEADPHPTVESGEHRAGVDHDQVARAARGRRLITDIDRVHALADAHGGEHPDWREVAVLLSRVHATLSRDLPRYAPGATTYR